MKILFACHGIGNGGAERVLLTLANSFSERGNEVSLITTNPPHNDYEINKSIRRFICNPSGRKLPIFRVLIRIIEIRKIIQHTIPDCIVSFSANINVQVLFAGLFLRIPIVVSERTDPSRYPTSRFGRLLRTLSYHLATAVVFQTDDAKNYFPNSIRKKSKIIINPICISLPMAPQTQENRIIGVGSLGEQKNWEHAIQSFRLFSKTHPQYYFEIFGEGPMRDELQMIIDSDAELRGRVFLRGFSNQVSQIMLSSKMYVSSSIYEGISNAMLEALALGVPSICTDCPVGGARMFINNKENGILVPVNDVFALSEAMTLVADNEALAESLSKEAKKIIDRISPDKVLNQWEILMQEVVKKKKTE